MSSFHSGFTKQNEVIGKEAMRQSLASSPDLTSMAVLCNGLILDSFQNKNFTHLNERV
jgi:hypothetical protein